MKTQCKEREKRVERTKKEAEEIMFVLSVNDFKTALLHHCSLATARSDDES